MGEAYLIPNQTGPSHSVVIDAEKCVGCNSCAAHCRTQTIMPNPEKGKPPVILYPDECWFCACCVESCKIGAIRLNFPINQRIFFKRKETGDVFRIGGPDSPPQSYFKPPVG